MKNYRAQGAIEKPPAASAGAQLGQGATEYLVLLAVVLIVALVSVALLGFFPGMASDAQRTQSETYWKSASPIAITEWAAKYDIGWANPSYSYFRVRNSGVYPIRITGIIGPDGGKATQFYSGVASCGTPGTGYYSISDYYYLASGEEKTFGYYGFGLACDRNMYIASSTSGITLGPASSLCANSATNPGTLVFSSIGFEYIEYLDNNQQITKRQIGKQVVIKCLPA